VADLVEEAEPVLEVPGPGQAAVLYDVELVDRDTYRPVGAGDPEDVAGVGAAHLGADADAAVAVLAPGVDDVVHDDVEAGERAPDPVDHGFDAVGAGALPGTERDVRPVGGHDLV